MSENNTDSIKTQETVAEDEEIELARSAFKMRFGQYGFVLLIIAVSIVLMVLSPIFNRYLEAYEAVVVLVHDEPKIRILTPDGMPKDKRISKERLGEFRSGTYIRKENMAWNPYSVDIEDLSYDPGVDNASREPRYALPELYARYMNAWEGTITEVSFRLLPTVGGRPGEQNIEYRMSIALDDGSDLEITIPEVFRPAHLPSLGPERGKEKLEKILVDKKLRKLPLTWEPVFVED